MVFADVETTFRHTFALFALWRSQSTLRKHGYPITGKSFTDAEVYVVQGCPNQVVLSWEEN